MCMDRHRKRDQENEGNDVMVHRLRSEMHDGCGLLRCGGDGIIAALPCLFEALMTRDI